jgi:enamine deaminase RidA (YjgF/YER057c/UK114 family)
VKLEPLNPEALGKARGYSNGIVVPAGSRLLFIAGQVGWDKERRFPEAQGVDAFLRQFDRALKNILEVLKAAGAGPENVARLTGYVTDKKLYLARLDEVGRIWRENMGRWYPAMSFVEVRALIEDGALVELEATAALPSALEVQ